VPVNAHASRVSGQTLAIRSAGVLDSQAARFWRFSSSSWSRATLTGDFPLDMFVFYRIQAGGVSRKLPSGLPWLPRGVAVGRVRGAAAVHVLLRRIPLL
jgi:hypothetical protein